MKLAVAVAIEDDRFLAHAAEDEIALRRDLAFMSDELPGTREYPLQLFVVYRLAGEYFPADTPHVEIDQIAGITSWRMPVHCTALHVQ